MTVDANRVSDERLAEHIEVGRSAWSAMRSLTSDEIFSVVAELQSLRRSPSLSGGEVEVVGWMATETPDGVPDVTLRPDTAEAWRDDGFIVTPLVTFSSHQSVIAAKDAEIERLRAAFGQAGDQSIGQQLRIKVLEGEAEAWAAQLHHAEYDRDFNEKARANWKSRAEAAEARANAAEAAIHLIQEEAEKDNSPLGRSDSLALERIRTVLSTLNGAKP